MTILNPKIKIKNLPIVLLLCICCTMVPMFYRDVHPIYLFLIGINSFLSVYYMLYDDSKCFTLGKLINFFILIFFILANAIQYANNSVHLTFVYSFKDSDYILFQCLNFCILVAYNGAYNYFLQSTKATRQHKIHEYSLIKMIVISGIATLLILQHYNFNIFSLLFRGLTRSMMSEFEVGVQEKTSIASDLIFNKVIRTIPWAVYIISCCLKSPQKYRILFFSLTLLTVFPTGISRNAAAMYWLPVFLIKCDKYLRGNRFIYIMLIGIFLIFPLLNNFRHFSGEISFKLSFDYLDSINMDASQIFMALISVGLITYGSQLLGVFLFFVPRVIWPAKPIGSGAFLVEQMHGWFTNVSMPFFAEGYINFSYPGIILFLLVLAYITGRLDGRFWQWHTTTDFNPTDGYYLLFIGAIIFFMRGDLLSSFAYTVGICLSYYLTSILSRKNNGVYKI